MSPVIELSCEFGYEAAHWLPRVPADHQCRATHGHSYHLTVVVKGPVRRDGFVCDFDDIKIPVNLAVAMLDHRLLNDIEGLENPTVENQLAWLWERLNKFLPLHELRLRETDRNSAVYRGETND